MIVRDPDGSFPSVRRVVRSAVVVAVVAATQIPGAAARDGSPEVRLRGAAPFPDARLRALAQDPGGRWAVPEGFTALGGPDVRVHHAPGDSARADRMLRYLRGQPPLPGLPDTVPRDVDVYLAPDAETLQTLTGGRTPEWGAGVAVPRLGRIVMPGFEGINTRGRTEARVLRHEWAHVALGQHLAGLRVPRWFDEGYAEWASGGWNAQEGWRLRIALTGDGPPTLDSLTLRWPRDRSSARVAYMLAGTSVEYLVERSGLRGLELLLDRAAAMGSFEDAFRSVYGVTTGQFEEDWRQFVEGRYGWLFVLSHSMVFWLFLALVLVGMFWIRRRHNRREMARLRATEPPADPAWWAEEPPGWGRGPTHGPGDDPPGP